MSTRLCAPALVYLAFSLTQVIADTFLGLYNTALVKMVVAAVMTAMLNALCARGMGIVSWLIVMIPFMLMSVVVGVLLFALGLSPGQGLAHVRLRKRVRDVRRQR